MATVVRKRSGASPMKARNLDAQPDRIDIRDWSYAPSLAPLPDALDCSAETPLVLDQGTEGACTGFALAGVINLLLARRGLRKRLASPRMLYEMARCYDEWPGEDYEGSSARGAMKGWARHGVADERRWPNGRKGRQHLDAKMAHDASAIPCGAYYRVGAKEVRDIHSALTETGAVYCTSMVHEGWDAPGPLTENIGAGKGAYVLPVIQRSKRAGDCHAFVLVGYTRNGFIVQNSWGKGWGHGGFALLPYEDFLLHATDVWVAQLGVPLDADLWATKGAADSAAGRFRGGRGIPLAEIRPYIVDVGNNGELSQTGDYWTSEDDLKRLFEESIPETANKLGWQKKRVMLYLHGGLNSERDAAKRAVAFRDKFLANGIYPLHVMWETGPLETLGSMLDDVFTDADERAGGRFLEGMRNAKDRVLELTAAPIGGAMWSEMKENAWRASDHRDGRGAMQLMQKYAKASLAAVSKAEQERWELHVVAHSAGSILFAHALEHLCALGISFKTLQFFAPAVTITDFQRYALPWFRNGKCPKATLYCLGEQQEEDDSVGPYGRSLLWLVSNAFEKRRGTPLLGMHHYLVTEGDAMAAEVRAHAIGDLLVSPARGVPGGETTAEEHGSFDNDAPTMNSVLSRILDGKPKVTFEPRDLNYG